jgi:ATP-dependent exoDNAse (exonuclease V) beta subunit
MLGKLLYVGMTRAIDNLMVIRPITEHESFAGIADIHWNTVPGSANPAVSDD